MRDFIEKHDQRVTRTLEILSGLSSWTLLTSPFWASFFAPVIMAYFIILFDLYFLYRATHLGINSIRGYLKIKETAAINWLETLIKSKLNYSKVRHIIFIPTYKEPIEILQRTLLALKISEFPTSQIDIVLATEEREEKAVKKAKQLQKEFKSIFGHFWITTHPLIPGEVAGKSSNLAFSAQEIKRKIEYLDYDKSFVTVTSCDADVVMPPKYYSLLTYQFLTLPKEARYLRFWQGALVYYNNIWRVPMPVRVVHTLYSVYQVANLMTPKSIFNYSTYSTSWKLVEEAGFWDVDVISEDWHLFFKCFITHRAKVELESVYLPLSADAAEGQNYVQSLLSQYNQNRRWAWGVTDIAYAAKQFLLNFRELSITPFFFRFLKALEQHIFWPVHWWILTLGATIPPLINPAFKFTALGHNLPKISGFILTISVVFLLSVIVVDYLLKPPRPDSVKKRQLPLTILQYFLMPVVSFFFGALPGMEAHTRLILGKRIEYRVTEKFK